MMRGALRVLGLRRRRVLGMPIGRTHLDWSRLGAVGAGAAATLTAIGMLGRSADDQDAQRPGSDAEQGEPQPRRQRGSTDGLVDRTRRTTSGSARRVRSRRDELAGHAGSNGRRGRRRKQEGAP